MSRITARQRRPWVALLTATLLVAGCAGPVPTARPALAATPPPVSSPGRVAASASADSPSASPIDSPVNPSPTLAPAPSPASSDPFVGKVVVTVSDNLVVRSQPRVSTDSIMYQPWLPLGTELTVLDGPVSASGYTWYRVAPVSFAGLSGPGDGWVAMAGKDGEAWIALSKETAAGPGLAISTVARALADPAAAKTAAASINAFGLDLFRQLLTDPSLTQKNAVFSPTSIALALGMARAGAKGETASQMDGVLHTTGWDALGPGLNSLDQALDSRNATWQADWLTPPTRQLALRIANAAYGQQGWTIEQPYLDAIAAAFGAGLNLVDFISHPAAALQTINAWVSERTNGRIPALLKQPDVTPATRIALVNAVYLKAEWEAAFRTDATKPAPFTRLDGSRVSVPTMFQTGGAAPGLRVIPYASGNGWQAVELRYKGGAAYGNAPLAMTLVLPTDLAAFEKTLSAAGLARITTALAAQRATFDTYGSCPGEAPGSGAGCYPYALQLYLPRFGIETRADLRAILGALGMPLAFDVQRADFTGIDIPASDTDRLFVAKVIHQATIDVDEKGTEAAAATGVLGETGGGPSAAREITLRLDHPFLFFVRDLETGAVLFMGQVTDPSAGKGS